MRDDNKIWRSQTYALLARLLASAPDQPLLDNLASIKVNEAENPIDKLWLPLITVANNVDVAVVKEEYQLLFIGVTQGELIPYGSYYQTGFLMEEPLAELRADLVKLGLERQQDTAEPEDHVAAQCDVMRLILTMNESPAVIARQFFQRHLQPWLPRLFEDMSQAQHAKFYRVLGQFAAGFMKLELILYDC